MKINTKLIIFALALSIGNLVQASSYEGDVGVFTYSIELPNGWNVGKSATTKANQILTIDQVQLLPIMAVESSSSVIFATWKELSSMAFTVAQLNADTPQLPSSWGIPKNNIITFTGNTSQGFEYSAFRVAGMGDGKTFSKLKQIKTFGVWIDLPITYLQESQPKSGLLSVYYRGIESDANVGMAIIRKLLNSLNLKEGILTISIDQFKKNGINAPKSENKNLETIQSISPSQKSVNQDASKIKNEFNNNNPLQDFKFNPQISTGLFLNEKGNLFCFNRGVVTPAPCPLIQPGANGAELSKDIIDQINFPIKK